MKMQSRLEVYRVGVHPNGWVEDDDVEMWGNVALDTLALSDSESDSEMDFNDSGFLSYMNSIGENYYGEYVLPPIYHSEEEITPAATPNLTPERTLSYGSINFGYDYGYYNGYTPEGTPPQSPFEDNDCIVISDDDSLMDSTLGFDFSNLDSGIVELITSMPANDTFNYITVEDLIDLISEGNQE